MTFNGKKAKRYIYKTFLVTLVAGFCLTVLPAEINNITDSGQAFSLLPVANAQEINSYNESSSVKDEENKKKAETNKSENTVHVSKYYTETIYFTEDAQRYVVVYPNNTYVSLNRNESSENKTYDEICRFL